MCAWLLLDLLATGDVAGVDAATDGYSALYEVWLQQQPESVAGRR